MRLILASQSPFRKHALDVLGLKYEVIPSNIDESAIQHEDPYERAQLLSKAKSQRIGEGQMDAIIISADFFVVHNKDIIEKPRDEKQAKEMLKLLSDTTFQLISGLSVYNTNTGKMLSCSESCTVKFRELSDFEMDDYISRYPVTKCAGAFEADGLLRFAEHIEGNYNFRAGLPVNKLILFLRENEIKV
ncbi:MAG: nucleoside triphosphate pyrophosphatase, partial [Candidatus Aenigmatarchaeota archaeon]